MLTRLYYRIFLYHSCIRCAFYLAVVFINWAAFCFLTICIHHLLFSYQLYGQLSVFLPAAFFIRISELLIFLTAALFIARFIIKIIEVINELIVLQARQHKHNQPDNALRDFLPR